MFAVIPALLFAAAPITVDEANHSVTLTAVSTDCGLDTQLEFLLVGPTSDRDYESMFVTEASVGEIARAFEKAGIPTGSCHDPASCVFWPSGTEVMMEPSFSNLVRQVRDVSYPPIAYTGGAREEKGAPVADTNMPSAVFALYNCGQSLLQINDNLDQSTTYGRFQPAVKIPKGEKRTFTFSLDTNAVRYVHRKLTFAPGNLGAVLTDLKESASRSEVEVLADFSPELTLKEAKDIATALTMIDSVRVKLNGFVEGQLFFRAYLPLEKWRDRKERLVQPPELHLNADGTVRVVEIVEDWSDDEKLEPNLIIKEHASKSIAEACELATKFGARPLTVLIFASAETKLEKIYEIRKGVKCFIPNWYVFTE